MVKGSWNPSTNSRYRNDLIGVSAFYRKRFNALYICALVIGLNNNPVTFISSLLGVYSPGLLWLSKSLFKHIINLYSRRYQIVPLGEEKKLW